MLIHKKKNKPSCLKLLWVLSFVYSQWYFAKPTDLFSAFLTVSDIWLSLYMHISVVIPLLQYLVNQYIMCTFVEITKEKNRSYVINIFFLFFFLSLKHSKWKEPFELRCSVWEWGRGLWLWNGQQSSKFASLCVRATFLKQAVGMFCDAAVWKCRNI